jgi:hypothetical protein
MGYYQLFLENEIFTGGGGDDQYQVSSGLCRIALF